MNSVTWAHNLNKTRRCLESCIHRTDLTCKRRRADPPMGHFAELLLVEPVMAPVMTPAGVDFPFLQ